MNLMKWQQAPHKIGQLHGLGIHPSSFRQHEFRIGFDLPNRYPLSTYIRAGIGRLQMSSGHAAKAMTCCDPYKGF
jgi:hypothetical protein